MRSLPSTSHGARLLAYSLHCVVELVFVFQFGMRRGISSLPSTLLPILLPLLTMQGFHDVGVGRPTVRRQTNYDDDDDDDD